LFTRLTTALSSRYRIERELGAGGMAMVYLTEDLKHKRKVALKVLRPELAAVIGREDEARRVRCAVVSLVCVPRLASGNRALADQSSQPLR
jgi:serine/threonine protein kinase